MPTSKDVFFDFPQDKKIICISNGWSRANEGIWQRKTCFHYEKLIETILSFFDNTVVYLLGNEEDQEWAEKMLSFLTTFSNNRLYSVCGHLNILETAYFISQSDFGIYNDGAVMHKADALKKPGSVTVRA